jgi:hypothetical protein
MVTSTTAMLRKVHAETHGDLDAAFNLLRAWSHDSGFAFSALRVLRMKITRKPRATTFSVCSGSGFVTVD